MMVRGEPEYVDQVPRRAAFEASHPNVEIIYLGPYWQAIIREEAGQTIITRYELRGLLDKLESIEDQAGGDRRVIRFRETRGRSWRGSQPGTREWESRSGSYGLFCRLSWLFCASVWYLAFPLWLAAELCMLAASALVVLPGGPSAQIALRPRSRQAAC